MPVRTYPLEALTATAASSTSMTDFLEKYGLANAPPARRNMARRLRSAGIDTSHWDRRPRRVYSDHQLTEAVAAAISVAGVLRLLGVPYTGGQHAHLANRIRAAGIDTSHLLGRAHSRGSTRPGRDPAAVLVLRPPGSGRTKTPTLLKAMEASGVERRCSVCGGGPVWQGRELTLVIDHLSGDFCDNCLENLRFPCPNCHAQTATWCRKLSSREKP